MIEILGWYLLIGALLTEGANWATKRRGLPALTFNAYVAGVTIWPIIIVMAMLQEK